MRPAFTTARPFGRPRGASAAPTPAEIETEAVVLKSKLYQPPGHTSFPAGSTVELPKALADELIRLGQAELPPAEPTPAKAAKEQRTQ